MSSLDPRTHKVLLDSFRANRLAVVNIDLQPCFFPDDALCTSVKTLSSSLRQKTIDNIWVAYSGDKMEMSIGRTNVHSLTSEQHSGRNILNNVGAHEDDVVILKDEPSAFLRKDPPLHRHLMQTNKDTLLITGVTYNCCVGETIQDLILSDEYNVIAVGDCINIPIQTHSGYHCYARDLFNACAIRTHETGGTLMPRPVVGDRYQRRFHLTTSDLIINALA